MFQAGLQVFYLLYSTERERDGNVSSVMRRVLVIFGNCWHTLSTVKSTG